MLGAVVAALIVAIALLGGSYLMSRSMDEMRKEVAGLNLTIDKLATPRPPAAQQAAAGGLDPAKHYTINTKGAPVRGAESAKITIVEVSDFQCPFCSRVEPTLKQILKEYPDKVQIAYKHFPLDFHPKAPAAHAAAEAAHQQGKFWEMYEKIFANQAEMAPEKYEVWAGELGLDVARFKKDVASAEVKQRIDADKQEVVKVGVTGTPGFFINGRYLSGAQPYESFKALIEEELNGKKG
jgi:protein-disulfide isomerase